MPLPESDKIPTTLVVGFLGSGKSSLINHILASRPTKPDGTTTRCAVVENELGEVGIDSHLGEFAFFLFLFLFCVKLCDFKVMMDARCRSLLSRAREREKGRRKKREQKKMTTEALSFFFLLLFLRRTMSLFFRRSTRFASSHAQRRPETPSFDARTVCIDAEVSIYGVDSPKAPPVASTRLVEGRLSRRRKRERRQS